MAQGHLVWVWQEQAWGKQQQHNPFSHPRIKCSGGQEEQQQQPNMVDCGTSHHHHPSRIWLFASTVQLRLKTHTRGAKPKFIIAKKKQNTPATAIQGRAGSECSRQCISRPRNLQWRFLSDGDPSSVALLVVCWSRRCRHYRQTPHHMNHHHPPPSTLAFALSHPDSPSILHSVYTSKVQIGLGKFNVNM